jgi:hypothetical protein
MSLKEARAVMKYDKFVAALQQLCREHGVQLATSGYDSLQVWDLDPGDETIFAPGVEDKTNKEKEG